MFYESKILLAICILLIIALVIAVLDNDNDPPDISCWK
jgi:hypothetical protein